MVSHRHRGAGSAADVFAARQELVLAPEPVRGVGWEAAFRQQDWPRLREAALLKIQHCETTGTSSSLLHRLEPQDVCSALTCLASCSIAKASSSSSSPSGNRFWRGVEGREQEEGLKVAEGTWGDGGPAVCLRSSR